MDPILSENYVPPDPTQIDSSDIALDFWSRTLGVPISKIRESVQAVGPELDTVKSDLGIGGVG